ncbi:MAG: phosphomannomutase/phosphoglucomutase [Candidatus Ratteibacteria bacterium]
MQIPRIVFREYDIRGLVATQLTPEFANTLGKAYGTWLEQNGMKSVAVGGDNRETTPKLRESLIQGLYETGRNVCDIGEVPTPILYFAQRTGPYDAGVMVTASHNPPEFNGFKLVAGKACLYGSRIQEVADIAEKGEFYRASGTRDARDFSDAYISLMKEKFLFTKPLRIGVDTGNGTVGPFLTRLYHALGITFEGIHLESDNTFPAHLPDPIVPANLKDLQNIVTTQSLDAGIGFDGDGDRIGAIAEDGSILWGDQLMILFSRDLLSKHPGATVIFDVKCSRALEESITKAGGKPLMWKTGHSLIEDKLHETGALLAGELSGHIYFADEYFGYDDALYSSLRLILLMDRTDSRLSELLADVPRYYASPEIRIEAADNRKFEIVSALQQWYRGKFPVSEIDGVKVYFPDGWALVRASNTQPALVLRIEGNSEEALNHIKEGFLAKVNEFLL